MTSHCGIECNGDARDLMHLEDVNVVKTIPPDEKSALQLYELENGDLSLGNIKRLQVQDKNLALEGGTSGEVGVTLDETKLCSTSISNNDVSAKTELKRARFGSQVSVWRRNRTRIWDENQNYKLDCDDRLLKRKRCEKEDLKSVPKNAESQLENVNESQSDRNGVGTLSVEKVDLKTYRRRKETQALRSSLDKYSLGSNKKKLLVLDVNGLLADIVPSDRYTRGDTIISNKAVFIRPYCEDFLQFCFERFNVGVWSSRTKYNVEKAIKFIMGDRRHKLLFCWDQSHCTSTGFTTLDNTRKPLLLKELKKIWNKLVPNLPWEDGEYNEANTLLLDDSPYKAIRNLGHTAIFPNPYRFRDAKTDCSLGPSGDLRLYLEGLANVENVRTYVAQNPFGQQPITETDPSWGFYYRVINAESESHK